MKQKVIHRGLDQIRQLLETKVTPEAKAAIEKFHKGDISSEELKESTQVTTSTPEEMASTANKVLELMPQDKEVVYPLNADQHVTVEREKLPTPESIEVALAENLLDRAGVRAEGMLRGQKHAKLLIENYTKIIDSLLLVSESLDLRVRLPNHPDADKDGFVGVVAGGRVDQYSPSDMIVIAAYAKAALEEMKTNYATLYAQVKEHESAGKKNLEDVIKFREQIEKGEKFVQEQIIAGVNAHKSEHAKEMDALKLAVDSRFARFYVVDDRPFIIFHTKKAGKYLGLNSDDIKPKLSAFKTVEGLASAKKFKTLERAEKVLKRMQLNKRQVSVKNPHRYMIGRFEIIAIDPPEEKKKKKAI